MKYVVTYDVETLRSGQSRPYADSNYEYLITIRSTTYGTDGMIPWVSYGDIEAQIVREETDRKAGRMFGGMSPDQLRKEQKDWAKKIVRALCRNFREKDDEDGRKGMDAHFYPTLQSLKIDPIAGTIRALIVEPYTD